MRESALLILPLNDSFRGKRGLGSMKFHYSEGELHLKL